MFYFAATSGIEPVIDKTTGKEIGERPALRFNPANFRFNIPSLEKNTKRLLTLKLLIHEQVHITQSYVTEQYKDEDGVPTSIDAPGLTSHDEHLDITRNAFNEGLVEKIADKILEEYLKRSGYSSLLQERYHKTYDIGRMLIDILIQKIHNYSGVPEDQIFNALVRASYDGQDILDDGLFSDGGQEIRAFIEEHQYTAPHSVNIPTLNTISQEEKNRLVNIFSKEIDIQKYSDTYVLKFLKKYGIHKK